MLIRDATPGDAATACETMRRSIAELCIADHGNDATILAQWLANKQPDVFRTWLANPDASLLVAVECDAVIAVGGVTNAGEITLNYVSPDVRFRGVSRAMLRALEARAAEWGNTRCRLHSTATARRFYLAHGYVEDGRPAGNFGMTSSYPMVKPLPPADH